VYRQDFSNFFKATQPIIDEQGLNPTEFNLLSGIYLVNTINMRTYRKDRCYNGLLPLRDFHYLDCKLLNLDYSTRKYISGSVVGVENQAKTYAHNKLRIQNEKAYDFNMQKEVFREKRSFNKQMIRSRQLKRCLMILMSKNTLPSKSKDLKAIINETNEMVSWKIMTKMD